ncbi:ionotropic receptor 75a isoform X3 [Halyomorpha halys]|uniref:ionotropic receptor 75a isoform X3 n=1 Tax=Halyomorpha halys TaxID=286706 RepID=UPI0034D2A3FF
MKLLRMIFFIFCYEGTWLSSHCYIPDGIHDVIDFYFRDLFGAHLYFCKLEDAVKAFKRFTSGGPKYNIRHNRDFREPHELLMSYWQPSRLGIFLDTSCDHGIFFFNYMIDIKFNESNLLEPLLDKTYEPGKDMVRRYGLAVFLHVAELYNFTYNYILTNAWGDPQPDGTWTGMVGQVARGEAEFGLAPAKYIVQRFEIIDFINSMHIVKCCFTFLQPKLFGSAKALVLPLDEIVWVCLAVLGILSVIVFRILAKYDNTGLSNDSWGGSALLVVGAISQQGIPDNTEKVSTRIVYIFLLIVSFFVAVYYNTAILNGLLLPAPNAIQDIEQLLKSDIKLGMLDIPYLRNELIQNDTMTIRVREKIAKAKPKQIFYSVPDGVRMIKKGKFALFTEDEAIYTEILHQMTDGEVCSVSEVLKYNPFHVGAVAKKNSPYKELFNRAFAVMRERGILKRQLEHWLVKKPECNWKQDALSLSMEPLALAYALFSFGAIFSFFILGFEIIHSKKSKKKAFD